MNKILQTDIKKTIGSLIPLDFNLIEINSQVLFIKQAEIYLVLHPYYLEQKKIDLTSLDQQKKCIHIYQDQWFNQKEIIVSRIKNLLGLSHKIAARLCIFEKISKPIAASFFKENHLLGSCHVSNNYGLVFKGNLVLVASFSKSRVMVDGEVYYRSYELVRLASLKNHIVVGGVHKILQNFIKLKNAVHIMTYIDLNFGDGKSFEKFGFKKMGSAQLQGFYLNPNKHERISVKNYQLNDTLKTELIYIEEYSTQKMILDLR